MYINIPIRIAIMEKRTILEILTNNGIASKRLRKRINTEAMAPTINILIAFTIKLVSIVLPILPNHEA